MKLFYIANSRIPTEKAHGIQIMKMCEAFASRGIEVELILPWRFNKIKQNPFEYYGINKKFSAEGGSAFGGKITKLPSLDLIPLKLPKIGFLIQAFSFGFFTAIYLLLKSNKEDVIYSRDEFSLWFLSFFRRNVFLEAHNFPNNPKKYARIFKKINGIVVISGGLKKAFENAGVSLNKIFVAPDGVDLAQFDISESAQECREKLGLPQNKKIILYTGHLYKWKGVDTLIQASKFLHEDMIVYLVGGTDEDIRSYKPKIENYSNIIVVGHKPHKEIPCWLKAADVLVLLNSSKEPISALYTSPLKLFEYMAAKKPIVASDLPSLREILNENNAILVESDNAVALTEGIKKIFSDKSLADKIALQAFKDVKNYTWENRVVSILSFLKQS